ncbi:hypothetical protein L226DRAFT_285393 [Lentinus tigrinus ALCF2SS1-7]|uniref:uncharacterized protein n=1 Tax=Lentinus tigrinus ALCF2SS1-7 TaxID=1328758 RepID=UPI001165EFA8|nr:hypothetical protein L226DRAFT_285393 [Lentinus tigrinus ALCF2SS1-7]
MQLHSRESKVRSVPALWLGRVAVAGGGGERRGEAGEEEKDKGDERQVRRGRGCECECECEEENRRRQGWLSLTDHRWDSSCPLRPLTPAAVFAASPTAASVDECEGPMTMSALSQSLSPPPSFSVLPSLARLPAVRRPPAHSIHAPALFRAYGGRRARDTSLAVVDVATVGSFAVSQRAPNGNHCHRNPLPALPASITFPLACATPRTPNPDVRVRSAATRGDDPARRAYTLARATQWAHTLLPGLEWTRPEPPERRRNGADQSALCCLFPQNVRGPSVRPHYSLIPPSHWLQKHPA